MKVVEIIFILFFTLIATFLILQLFLKFPKEEKREIVVENKKHLISLTEELYYKCLKENENKKIIKTCYIILYNGNEKVRKNEFRVPVNFEEIFPREYLEILYKNGKIEINKVEKIVT
jgi:hypothetical protein